MTMSFLNMNADCMGIFILKKIHQITEEFWGSKNTLHGTIMTNVIKRMSKSTEHTTKGEPWCWTWGDYDVSVQVHHL